jgi:hypothetical protein
MKSDGGNLQKVAPEPRKNARSKTANPFPFNTTIPKNRAFMHGFPEGTPC